MVRCRLWRYVPAGGGDRMSPPGGDAKQWRPCRNVALPDAPGCDACYTALILCPNVQVRRALAVSVGTPVDVLEVLGTDGDGQVAAAARAALTRRQPATPAPAPAAPLVADAADGAGDTPRMLLPLPQQTASPELALLPLPTPELAVDAGVPQS